MGTGSAEVMRYALNVLPGDLGGKKNKKTEVSLSTGLGGEISPDMTP